MFSSKTKYLQCHHRSHLFLIRNMNGLEKKISLLHLTYKNYLKNSLSSLVSNIKDNTTNSGKCHLDGTWDRGDVLNL